MTELYYFADGAGPRRRPEHQDRGVVTPRPQWLLSNLPFSAWWTADPNATRVHLGGPPRPTWSDFRYRALDSLEALQGREDIVRWVAVRDLFDATAVAHIEREEFARPDTWYLGLRPIAVQRDRTYDRRAVTA